MQVESDATYITAIADAYEGNLKRLMDLIRAVLDAPDFPVVIGQISDSKANSDPPPRGSTGTTCASRCCQRIWNPRRSVFRSTRLETVSKTSISNGLPRLFPARSSSVFSAQRA